MYLPPSQIPIPARNAESHGSYGASLVAQMVKNLPAMRLELKFNNDLFSSFSFHLTTPAQNLIKKGQPRKVK